MNDSGRDDSVAQSHAQRFAAWACVFSPLVPRDVQQQAWRTLGVPLDYDRHRASLTQALHLAMPAPKAPTLLHVALSVDGGALREIWVRILDHLSLTWNDKTLPPDHLAVACEAMAVSLLVDESVLQAEIPTRFLLPWCAMASQRLQGDPLVVLPELFNAHLHELARTDAGS